MKTVYLVRQSADMLKGNGSPPIFHMFTTEDGAIKLMDEMKSEGESDIVVSSTSVFDSYEEYLEWVNMLVEGMENLY